MKTYEQYVQHLLVLKNQRLVPLSPVASKTYVSRYITYFLRGSRAQAKIQILDLKKVKGISISLTFFVEVEVIKGRTRYFRHLTSRCGLNTGPSIKNGRAEIYKVKFRDENLVGPKSYSLF